MTAPHPLVRQLQSLREAAGLSPNDVARRADIRGNTIRAWEDGVCGPTVYVAEKVAATFGVALGLVAPGAGDGDDVARAQFVAALERERVRFPDRVARERYAPAPAERIAGRCAPVTAEAAAEHFAELERVSNSGQWSGRAGALREAS